MQAVPRRSSPRDPSFSVADLILIRSWAQAQGLHIAICLDRSVDGEQHENVLTFPNRGGERSRSLMWRDGEAIFVQPPTGRPRPYSSVAAMIDALHPEQQVVPTDIEAASWPT